jgi:AraC-like DNA-binding protein
MYSKKDRDQRSPSSLYFYMVVRAGNTVFNCLLLTEMKLILNHAAALLLNTKTAISEISHAVGYGNSESFVRVFQADG